MGTRKNRLTEASTHNLCFGSEIRKIGIPLYSALLCIKVGFIRVYFSWTCFPDECLTHFALKEGPDRVKNSMIKGLLDGADRPLTIIVSNGLFPFHHI